MHAVPRGAVRRHPTIITSGFRVRQQARVWPGERRGWHDARMHCCLKLAVPIANYRHVMPFPLRVRPILTSLHTLPFPWYVVPMEPPDCPRFTALCRVHTKEGNGPRHWPGASRRTRPTGGGGTLPNGGFWACDVHFRGHLPDGGT